jgi:hypothetical protein
VHTRFAALLPARRTPAARSAQSYAGGDSGLILAALANAAD